MASGFYNADALSDERFEDFELCIELLIVAAIE